MKEAPLMNVNQTAVIMAIARARSPLTQPQRRQLVLEHGPQEALALVRGGHNILGLATDDEVERARADVESWYLHGYTVTTILDDEYPYELASIHEAPLVVYGQGEIRSRDEAVAVVGSRAADAQSLHHAGLVAGQLVQQGFTVVSGLARGIDGRAHEGALAAGGRTVGVMGTGLERTYPVEHEDLRQRIVASGGLVLTQFEPYAGVSRGNFPMRNITMSGYSMATIVVAAGENSGTRHHVRGAMRHGRHVILLAPVVHTTQWAKDLQDKPGVSVAHDMSELKDILSELCRQRQCLTVS